MWLHDVFISHASEDKDTFVRSLAERLRTEHVEVWYDEFALRMGDSLRASIDRGLSRSRFGIVVLSKSFFSKRWPERELNGLVARELAGLARVILPIWHGVTRDEVIEFSPPLADVLASNSALGIEAVVRDVLAVVRPRGSPLVVARDELAKQGLRPPVITDEYWLDVVEASNRESGEGFVLQRAHWGRWSFPLPPESRDPVGRGRRLAFVAMQLAWSEAADAQHISQITPPEGVLSFIENQPGLAAACRQSPAHLAVYAPQLTIPAFSGPFAGDFDSALRDSHTANESLSKSSPRSGTALTVDGTTPACGEWIAFRDPDFGRYRARLIASAYFEGAGMSGPSNRFYARIDYVFWLLSEASFWLPERFRDLLVDGSRGLRWIWDSPLEWIECDRGIVAHSDRGALCDWLFAKRRSRRLPSKVRNDLVGRAAASVALLNLPEPADELVERFLARGFVDEWPKPGRRGG